MKINPGNARGLLVPQGDRPFSFVVYSSEIRDFGLYATIIETETKVCPNKKCNLRNYKDDDHLRSSYVEQNAAWIDQVFN